MQEVATEEHTSVTEVTAKMSETKIADQLQDAACTDVTQGKNIMMLKILQ